MKNIRVRLETELKNSEKNIAESITNNQKIQIMKEDMLEANKKLNKYRSLEGFEFKDSLGTLEEIINY